MVGGGGAGDAPAALLQPYPPPTPGGPSLPWATTPDLDSVDARSPESVMGRFITMQVCSDGYAAGGLAFDNVQQQSLGC
jgi:hypothetical protein